MQKGGADFPRVYLGLDFFHNVSKLKIEKGVCKVVLDKFYAVSKTSTYRVTDKKDEHGWPIVEKIAIRTGVKSSVAVGERLENGSLVGITGDGMVLYNEQHPNPGKIQKPEEVTNAFMGGRTSPIVALFLRQEEAIECMNSSGLEGCDPRWQNKTKEVVGAIGDNHPVFILSKWEPVLK